MSRWKSYGIVSLVATVVMLTNLGGPRLWDRDEPRNAGCAAEMLARGDWIVPVFNAELRTHKPILLYWLMMASYSMLGVSEFAARLPSALLAIGTALCTCEMGRHLFSPRAGVWAGITVATSLMFVVAGRAATPDATLVFFSTLAITVFVLAIPARPDDSSQAPDPGFQVHLSLPQAVCMFGAMGMGALAKGPIGVLLPAAIIGLFQLLAAPCACEPTSRGWRERFLDLVSKFIPHRCIAAAWSLRPLTGLAVVLVVAAPWYVWVGLRTDGEFLRGFFLEHNLSRALSPMEGHRGNVLFYPVTLLIGMFPWTVFLVPVLIDLTQRLRQRDSTKSSGFLFAACWLFVYLGVFTVAKTKLPSYITPSYPAAAILFGAYFDHWLAGRTRVPRVWLEAACAVLAFVGLVLVVVIPFVVRERLPGEEILGLLGVAPLVAGVTAWWFVRREKARPAAWCVAGAATAFATLLFAVGAQRVDQHQMSHQLLHAIERHSLHPHVSAYACLEPSWVFYGGRPIDELTAGSVGPTHAPHVTRNGRWVPKPKVTVNEILENADNSLIITTGRELAAAKALLPADFQVLEKVPLFLKEDDLYLLGRPHSAVIANRQPRADMGTK